MVAPVPRLVVITPLVVLGKRKPKAKPRGIPVSQWKAADSANSSLTGSQPRVPTSSARPVWCSLQPGGAITAKTSRIVSPRFSLSLTSLYWRSKLRNAEMMMREIPSAFAVSRILFHDAAASGTSKCSRPLAETSAITSFKASGYTGKRRCSNRSAEAPSFRSVSRTRLCNSAWVVCSVITAVE